MASSNGQICIVYVEPDAEFARQLLLTLSLPDVHRKLELLHRQAPGRRFFDEFCRELSEDSYLVLVCSESLSAMLGGEFGWLASLRRRACTLVSVQATVCEIPAGLRGQVVIDGKGSTAKTIGATRDFLVGEQNPLLPSSRSIPGSRGIESVRNNISLRVDGNLTKTEQRALWIFSASRQQLRKIAAHCLNESALKGYLFDEGISAGELQGIGLKERILSLLLLLAERNKVIHFAAWLQRERGSCVERMLTKLGVVYDASRVLPPELQVPTQQKPSEPGAVPFGTSPTLLVLMVGGLMLKTCITSSETSRIQPPPVQHSSADTSARVVSETPVRSLRPLVPRKNNNDSVEPGRNVAILFAGMRYDDPRWPALATPGADVAAIGEDLRTMYGFEVEQVHNGTVAQIRAKIRLLAQQKYSPGDQLLLMFAGHGDKDDTLRKGWIIARDTKVDGHESAYPFSELRDDVDSIPCPHILLVLDVCFGGTFDPSIRDAQTRGSDYEEVSAATYVSRKLRYRSRLYLSSVDQKTEAPEGRGHSPFTWKLLEALRMGGGRDGVLSWSELLSHLEKLNPEPRGGSFPNSTNHDPGGDFVFFRSALVGKTIIPPPAIRHEQ